MFLNKDNLRLLILSKNYLEHINSPKGLRQLKEHELHFLATEIRDFIIDVVAVKKRSFGGKFRSC